MFGFSRRPFDPVRHLLTPKDVWRQRGQHRREFLATAGAGLLATGIGCGPVASNGPVPLAPAASQGMDWLKAYPAPRTEKFTYGRAETEREAAARYTNFYEFTGPYSKESYRFIEKFQPYPWQVTVDGLCAKPRTFDLDDLHQLFPLEERAYRHRCVETWAMCVPWTGFELSALLKLVEPTAAAQFVRFETFNRPQEAEYIASDDNYPWPYVEGLTMAEAMNELSFLALGVYGEPLPKQHGAPIRLVTPWKYGFKCIKSVVRISLTADQPATFWNTVNAREYGFEANVEPQVPHPRWSQRTEWMLGTRERFDTQLYNGYGDYVAKLYL